MGWIETNRSGPRSQYNDELTFYTRRLPQFMRDVGVVWDQKVDSNGDITHLCMKVPPMTYDIVVNSDFFEKFSDFEQHFVEFIGKIVDGSVKMRELPGFVVRLTAFK